MEDFRLAHLAQEDSRMPARPETIGSLTRVVHELTQRLGRAYPLTVVSTQQPGDPADEQRDGIHHLRIPAGVDRRVLVSYFRWRNRLGRRVGIVERPYPGTSVYFYSYVRRAARRLAREQPDLIHLHNVTQFIPPLRRAVPGARLVLHMHCQWLVEMPRAVIAPRLADVDLVLGVSDHIVRQIQDAFPTLAARCRVLHNGVDLDAFPPRERVAVARRDAIDALRARLGIRGPVVLYVGRLSSEKGVHVLLEAFGRIRAAHPDATCLVVGPDWGPIRKVTDPHADPLSLEIARLDDGYMARLRRLAAPHGPRVVFTGALPNGELPLYHALADVLVAPSLLESFGIPPLEAAASGLPVVVSATGGLLDTVVPERTGLVVPPRDAGAVADAVLCLLADPGRARALGRAGRERVAAHFTWDRVTATLLGYYDALLSVPRAA
jgi:spore coat protein SA